MSVDDATLDELLTDAVVYAHDHVGKGGLPFVGVVVTTDGEVSPCGVNQVRATGDPTAHAEIVAMRSLATSHGAVALTGATLLATGEPCALCYRFAAQHGIRRVVYAVDQDAAAVWGFDYRSDPAALTTTEKALVRRAEHRPVSDGLAPFATYLQRHGIPMPTPNSTTP